MDKTLLDLYTDYLISSFDPVTGTGLSRLPEGEVSHDQVTRYLVSTPKTSADLWSKVKPLLRQVENEEGVVIIDDSIEEKPYTDENELICWHWDYSRERHVKGINFVTAFYQVGGRLSPLTWARRPNSILIPKPTSRSARARLARMPASGCCCAFARITKS